MLVSTRRQLGRLRMLRLLDNLEAAAGSAISAYILPGSPMPEIEKLLGGAEETPRDLTKAVARSTTGAVLFWGEPHRYLVLPPFPLKEERVSRGYDVEPLRSLLKQEFTIAMILVRLGAYAIGVFKGEKLLSSKVGRGYVHSRHRKGGSSQRRFERGREKQMEYLFERVCTRVRERLEPYVQQLDYVVYGGERTTLLSFRKRCPFLGLLDDRTSGWLLNIREPRQATLEAAIGEAWSSGVIQWYES
ncbi:MAG: Vms1/Ankzf1 family peptidyl-tRNA hydrolase [Dehalococcoidia bacterium]